MKVNRIALLGMTAFGLGALSVIDIEGMFSKDDPRYESSSGFSSFNASGDSTNQRTGQSAQGNFKQHQGTDYNSYTKDELLMMLLRFQEQSRESEQNLREMFATQLQQLTGEIKELKQQNKNIQEQNENIQKINEEQKHRIDGLEKDIAEAKKDAALLEQMRHNKAMEIAEADKAAAIRDQLIWQQGEAAKKEAEKNNLVRQIAGLQKERDHYNRMAGSGAAWKRDEIDTRLRSLNAQLESLR